MRRHILHMALRMASAIIAAVFMACQCVPPEPPEPTPPDPIDERSEELKDFMNKTELGLYVNSVGIVTYDDIYFQKAWGSGAFRIQRDDQSAYLSIVASTGSASSSYQVEYKNANTNVTLMLLKLQAVKTENSCVWLWNETMATGVIIPEEIN